MSNRHADTLFQLLKSLNKSEKRNFKLYVKRNFTDADLKVIRLFDAMDSLESYDEQLLLKKARGIAKAQLSNLKAHLYRLVLSSLRLIRQEDNITLQLHEQMDFARILYNKGLYLQALKVLDKMKAHAKEFEQFTYMQQILFFEKKIEALYITRSMQNRAEQLTSESAEVAGKISMISQLSDLSLQLYSWYIQHGVARNNKEGGAARIFFEKNLPPGAEKQKGFYELLYYYQCQCWVAFICQDFLQYYRYTQKWVQLFENQPAMTEVEAAHYIKGMHNLMGAHFDLANLEKLTQTISRFEKFSASRFVQQNENYRILCFVYLNIAKINRHFTEGTFTEGLQLVPEIEKQLKEYELYLDRHRILTFYYKIACLYFGSGDNEKTIEYLNRIINWKTDLRSDLQCYARLLHLIAHFELGNYNLLEYLIKSVYRFMGKMGSLSSIEEEVFRFLRSSFRLKPGKEKPAFEKLLQRMKKYEGNRFENRAFLYLDIISWLESKIAGVAVQDVIRRKRKNRHKKSAGL